MNQQLTEQCLEEIFQDTIIRLKKGIYHDKNLKLYEKSIIKKMVSFYETIEEYENCKFLVDLINDRFNHDQNYLVK